MLNLNLTYQAQILDLVVHLWVSGVFLQKRLRIGCDFSIMSFRDIGAFPNLPDTHFNIGFYLSDHSPGFVACVDYKTSLKFCTLAPASRYRRVGHEQTLISGRCFQKLAV